MQFTYHKRACLILQNKLEVPSLETRLQQHTWVIGFHADCRSSQNRQNTFPKHLWRAWDDRPLTFFEVGSDAGFCRLGHVADGSQALAGRCQKGQHHQPVHVLLDPGPDAAPEELCRWNCRVVHHHQNFHKEAAEGHVAGLAVYVWGGHRHALVKASGMAMQMRSREQQGFNLSCSPGRSYNPVADLKGPGGRLDGI